MPEPTKKRIGRPLKTPTEKRVWLGLKVRSDLKRRVDAAAKLSGRTQSQEAEMLIERGLVADEIAKIGGTTQEDLKGKVIAAALVRDGFAPKYGLDANEKTIVVAWERRKFFGFIDPAKEGK